MELISYSLMPVSILLDYAPCFSAKSEKKRFKKRLSKEKLISASRAEI